MGKSKLLPAALSHTRLSLPRPRRPLGHAGLAPPPVWGHTNRRKGTEPSRPCRFDFAHSSGSWWSSVPRCQGCGCRLACCALVMSDGAKRPRADTGASAADARLLSNHGGHLHHHFRGRRSSRPPPRYRHPRSSTRRTSFFRSREVFPAQIGLQRCVSAVFAPPDESFHLQEPSELPAAASRSAAAPASRSSDLQSSASPSTKPAAVSASDSRQLWRRGVGDYPPPRPHPTTNAASSQSPNGLELRRKRPLPKRPGR